MSESSDSCEKAWQECGKIRKDTRILRRERRSSFRLNNPEGWPVCCIQVDGCLFPDGGGQPRCDWLFEIEEKDCKRAWYVELKGKDVIHALEQLLASLTDLEGRHVGFGKHCVVVATRVPPGMRSSRQVLERRIRQRGAHVHVHTSRFEADICAP